MLSDCLNLSIRVSFPTRSTFLFWRLTSHLSFLPETLRKLVGDGSTSPSRLLLPVIPLIGRGRVHLDTNPEGKKLSKNPFNGFKNPLPLFWNLDITVLLLFNGIIYAEFYGVTASLSVLFADIYPFLNEATIGLCFMSIGGELGRPCHISMVC